MPKRPPTKQEERARRKTRERVSKHRAAARDCQYGEPEDWQRRQKLEKDTAAWLQYYFPNTFYLPFSTIHLGYIKDLDYIIEHGGWKAIAMPRGSGKTNIALARALKALLTRELEYCVITSANSPLAVENLSGVKMWLLHNERLAADYPEVCKPIRFSGGIPQAMSSITVNGEKVTMVWKSKKIVLPNCPLILDGKKYPRGNAVLDCDGLTAGIMGRQYPTPDGRTLRPDLAIPDDPQTAESSKSESQCKYRLDLITQDVAGSGGPDQDIRIIVPCTIREPDDLADQITDPEKYPDFLGERYPFFISYPKNWEAWEDYNEVRKDGLANRDGGKLAREYYEEHYETLTEGAEVSWQERSGDGALDGIQWGMNAYFRMGQEAFAKEYQNQPIPPQTVIELKKSNVLKCETDTPRWEVPFDPLATIAFIDVNPRSSGLHWAVMSFADKLQAQVIAYGVYPGRGVLVKQGTSDTEEDGILFEALRKVCGEFANQSIDANGYPGKIDAVLVDGGWKFALVQQFVQQARQPYELWVDRGRAATKYLDSGRDVMRSMENIHLRRNQKREKYLSHNSDVLRETAQRAFLAGPDAPGGAGIHKRPPIHDDFAEHMTAKKLADKAEGDKGMMYKWTHVPGSEDHWLDCIVGCYAGAHWYGIESTGDYTVRKKRSKPRKRHKTIQI